MKWPKDISMHFESGKYVVYSPNKSTIFSFSYVIDDSSGMYLVFKDNQQIGCANSGIKAQASARDYAENLVLRLAEEESSRTA